MLSSPTPRKLRLSYQTLVAILHSALTTASAFLFSVFRGSITSTFQLSAYYLVCLRLNLSVTR